MKNLVNCFIGFVLITISVAGIAQFMFADEALMKMRRLRHEAAKLTKGAIVYNHTSRPITISSDSYIGIIPPGKSSLEAGTVDADAVVIDQPMWLEGKIIENKVLKFCNLATIELTEGTNGVITINAKKHSWICKLANDYKLYNSIKEAFNQK